MDIDKPTAEVELIFEIASSLITVMDINGTTTYTNQEFMEISGFCREELIGLNHDMYWHSDMPVICRVNLWLTIKCDKPYRSMIKNRCKNGAFFWAESITAPLKENGQTVGYITLHSPPSREYVIDAAALYQELKAGEYKYNQYIQNYYLAAHEQINRPSAP